MARPLRIEHPAAVYHVTATGNARLPIFEDDGDRTGFLRIAEGAIERFNQRCYAFRIMDNHYHLLLETIEGNLPAGMRHIDGVYTRHFNRTHHRVGHLFQGRFNSILVDRDAYLLELCRYIVLNPVRAGMIELPEDYTWSSCRATAGLSPKPSFLHSDWIPAQLAGERGEARRRYMEFVRAGIGCGKIGDLLKYNAIPGGHEFMAKLGPALRDKSSLKEIPRSQRFACRPTLEELLPPHRKIAKRERNAVLKKRTWNTGIHLPKSPLMSVCTTQQ
jgi:putative transposase